jgi:hypothetical protein
MEDDVMRKPHRLLGDILLENNLITEEQLKSILDEMGVGKKLYDDPLTPGRSYLELEAADKEVVGAHMKKYIDRKFYALFIALIVSILSLYASAIADQKYNPSTNQMDTVAPNSTWKYNPYTDKWGYSAPNAAPTYNPHQNTWDMAPPNFQLKYNPMSQKWETASPDSSLIYNPLNNTWKYVSPDVSPQYNPSNDQRQYRR